MEGTEVFDEDVMGFIYVALVDKSRFKFAFRSTTTGPELVKQVCEKMGIRQPTYFGLKRLRNLRTEVPEDAAQKVWVAEKAPLFSQGCDSTTTLFLRHKYWFYDVEELFDETTLQVMFEETDRKLMSEKYRASDDTNFQLAACRIQIAHGDYVEGKQFVTTESIRYLIPSYIQDSHSLQDWCRLVEVFHQKLAGKTKAEAQRRYLALAKEQVRHLSVTFFPASFTTREMKKKVSIFVGINPDGIGLYGIKGERRVLQLFYRFRELQNWQMNPLWNNMEAPDYERPKLTPLEQELTEMLIGPYRVQMFVKTKSKNAKDLEVEVNSFIPEDDNVIMYMNSYNSRFEQFVSLRELDDADSKNEFLSISTLDGVAKKIRITADTTGNDLIAMFAEKINLQDSSYFQLSNIIDEYDRWLPLKEPVSLQGCTASSEIKLKMRFFLKDPHEITDPVARNLCFLQIRQTIISGDVPVSEEDAIELASLYLQTVIGDYDKKKEKKSGFLSNDLHNYVPFYLIDFHGSSWWERKIAKAHSTLKGLDIATVQQRYMRIASTMPNYGISYYNAIIPKTHEECLLGIGRHGVALFRVENFQLIASYRFGYELRSWSNDGESIMLTVKATRNAEERTVVVVSLLSAEILDLISYYDKMRKFEKKLAPENP